MQPKPDQRNKHLGEPALSSARQQAIREAARRVTLELLQHQQSTTYNLSNEGQIATSNPAQDSLTRPETRRHAAIQPVLEVVADSALRQSDSKQLQP